MPWTSPDSWLTAALSPTPGAILITLLVTLLLPVLVHSFLYRKGREIETPTFLLVGPSGGGKTALLTLVRRDAFQIQKKKLYKPIYVILTNTLTRPNAKNPPKPTPQPPPKP